MILVTGANGLVGSFVCRALLAANWPFYAMVRKGSDCSLLADVQDQVQWVTGDVTMPSLLIQSMQPDQPQISGVIHCAGFVSFDPAQEAKLNSVNVQGTAHVIDFCLKGRVNWLVLVSSVSAIGIEANGAPSTEETDWHAGALGSAYAKSKRKAEEMVWGAQHAGLKVGVVNPSVVLGVGQGDRSSLQLLQYVLKEHPFYINAILNYVDVRDVALCILQLVEKQAFGHRFIVHGGQTTYGQFFKQLAQAMGKRPPFIRMPKKALLWLAQVDRLRCRLLGGKALMPLDAAKAAQLSIQYIAGKSTQLLGLTYRPLQETLQWIGTELS